MMYARFCVVVAILLVGITRAMAEDAVAIAKQHDHAFDAATWRGGCSIKKALEFYEDNATAIYPGEGEVAEGKAAIEKLVENFLSSFCGKHKAGTIENDNIRAMQIAPDYIMIIRTGDIIDDGGVRSHMRATELIHKSGGKWRYLLDHASIGVPPENSGDKGSSSK